MHRVQHLHDRDVSIERQAVVGRDARVLLREVVLRRLVFVRDRAVLAQVRAHQRNLAAREARQQIHQRALAVIERQIVEVVEHARIAQRAQLRVHPAAAEHQLRLRRRRADRARHAKGTVHIAREGSGDRDDIGSLRRDELARQFVERGVDQRGLGRECLVQRIERRRARREALAVTRELEVRVDADAPDVGEVVDVEAREVARLLGGAEIAERRVNVFVERLCEARSFGQERAAHDAEGQARVAALQEADGRLDRRRVTIGVREEVLDRGRHDRAAWCGARALAQFLGHALDERRGKEAEEEGDGRVCLRHLERQVFCVLAQETRQVRRCGVRRIELDHRRRDEQDAHGACRVAHGAGLQETARFPTGQPERRIFRCMSVWHPAGDTEIER